MLCSAAVQMLRSDVPLTKQMLCSAVLCYAILLVRCADATGMCSSISLICKHICSNISMTTCSVLIEPTLLPYADFDTTLNDRSVGHAAVEKAKTLDG